MLVYREEGQTHEEDAFEALDVELQKKPGKGLGLTIVGRKNGPGVFISEVVSIMLHNIYSLNVTNIKNKEKLMLVIQKISNWYKNTQRSFFINTKVRNINQKWVD